MKPSLTPSRLHALMQDLMEVLQSDLSTTALAEKSIQASLHRALAQFVTYYFAADTHFMRLVMRSEHPNSNQGNQVIQFHAVQCHGHEVSADGYGPWSEFVEQEKLGLLLSSPGARMQVHESVDDPVAPAMNAETKAALFACIERAKTHWRAQDLDNATAPSRSSIHSKRL